MRVKVVFFLAIVGSGLLLFVPGALDLLFPFWTDAFRLLFLAAFVLSLMDLVLGIVFPRWWLELVSDLEGMGERVEVGTVTHLKCCFCGFEFRRTWIRGDFVGKADKECRLCHCSFKVKAIYAFKPSLEKGKN
jgi:hypothetical protein